MLSASSAEPSEKKAEESSQEKAAPAVINAVSHKAGERIFFSPRAKMRANEKGYKLDSNGECKACEMIEKVSGAYLSCPNEELVVYKCNEEYANVKDSNCEHCPKGCHECIYNKENDKLECFNCYLDYILNSDKTCSRCGDDCGYCFFDKNNKKQPICFYCLTTIYKDDNTCGPCPEGCHRCDENSNDECRKCYDNYVLDQKTKKCIYCGGIKEISEDYEACLFCRSKEIEGILNYQCLECQNDSYAYITNTYQCLNKHYILG